MDPRQHEPAGRDDLEAAVAVVREAAEVARAAFEDLGREVVTKPDGSEVTATDLVVEDLIRTRLSDRYPADGLLGEERPARTGASGRRWIIDPIGGTADFVRRIPLFSVDLALEDEHGPAVAVSALPASRLLLAGGRGLGCRLYTGDLAGPPLRVDDRAQLDAAVVAVHNLRKWPPGLLTALHARCALRDGVHSVLRLLTGEVHAVVLAGSGMGYDDLACLPVLVQEAGGRVTDVHGQPVLDGDGSVLATNGALHDELLDLVAAATR